MRIEIFTAAVLLLAAGCDRPAETPKSETPMPVRVLPVTSGNYRPSYEAVAQVKPFRTVDLVARISGFLQERPFREGSFVKKGELLYLIEPAQYRIAQENAQAQLDMMKARRDNAASEFGRIQQLYGEKIASPDRFDSAKAAKLEAEAAVLAAEAELRQAKLNYSYTRITAPFDGWIGLTSKDVGNYLQAPSGTLATLAQIDPVRVEFSVSDAFALPKLTAELQQGKAPELIVRVLQRDGTLYPEAGKSPSGRTGWIPKPRRSGCRPGSPTPPGCWCPANSCGCGWRNPQRNRSRWSIRPRCTITRRRPSSTWSVRTAGSRSARWNSAHGSATSLSQSPA